MIINIENWDVNFPVGTDSKLLFCGPHIKTPLRCGVFVDLTDLDVEYVDVGHELTKPGTLHHRLRGQVQEGPVVLGLRVLPE